MKMVHYWDCKFCGRKATEEAVEVVSGGREGYCRFCGKRNRKEG